MKGKVSFFLPREEGQGWVGYALILILIAVVAIGVFLLAWGAIQMALRGEKLLPF